eukprot:scaffold36666_cov43-Phaeocystis_antarctica.AAC.1
MRILLIPRRAQAGCISAALKEILIRHPLEAEHAASSTRLSADHNVSESTTAVEPAAPTGQLQPQLPPATPHQLSPEPSPPVTGSMPKKKDEDDDVSSVDVDEEVNEVEDDEAANDLANADVVTKYQTAGKIANECLAKVIAACVPGTKAVTLCLVGDEVRARLRRVE